MKDLSVLIVGGGAGLGALLAKMAVDAGAAKIGNIDINKEAAEAALGPAKAKGLPTAAAACDIQVGAQCHAAFDAIVAELERVDSLINCAAIYPRRPL
ncbi:SDR family NAD(P)-dependent oxidoreductase, partial [Mesorhizobium sp. M3A.F.Ca.ET.175.01.1.1]|uniref:SDR family NAD(P)-dependent oxidoreductase n=1 Tax=Mesorhizobium sp. M3A.F.Ca.ET.175.01.1.1 TaxID=2563945 RepID=UPI0010938EFB